MHNDVKLTSQQHPEITYIVLMCSVQGTTLIQRQRCDWAQLLDSRGQAASHRV